MGDFLRVLVDVLTYVWPFRPVEHWERGVYYVMGKAWKTVGPGRWPVVPYFMDVRSASVVPDPIIGPKQDVTLADGTTVTFCASIIYVVEDAEQALNEIHDYPKAVMEIMQRTVAMRLQAETAVKFTPAERGLFLGGILQTINAETRVFGVRARKLAFTSFIMNVATMRILSDGKEVAW
jgi:regulator of protease activity HflC (stomatin/prohibitin superfamily)